MNTTEFIEAIVACVQKYAPQYGICVHSPIIAQAVLESARGTSELAVKANNYFGLKYKPGRCPTATGIYYKVGSEQAKDGTYTSSQMRWCRFPDMDACVHGYFDFTNNAGYANLKGVTDPKTYLKNIKADKYATSLKYVDNLMAVIKRYDLTRFDGKKVESMSNSTLATYTRISPNKTSPRNHKIDTITIHCMAGNLTVERCGELFAKRTRMASSNYGIGSDGRIGLYVEEKDRSWCSSNKANDMRAITIEVANDGGAATGWHVSDAAMTSLIALVADICKRNGISKLVWSTNKNDRVNYRNGCNMTVHRDFKNKACPGDYLYGKHAYIAAEVNKRLGIVESENTQNSKVNHTTQQKSYVYNGIDYAMVFNPTYYAQVNTDVKNVFGNNEKKLFEHFCKNGMKEGRVAIETFNVLFYKANNADLQKAFGNNLPDYYKHYIQYGHKEGRKAV